jgi:hypothetical protein
VYAYSSAGCTIYVNSVFNLVKVEIGGTECPLQQLNGDQTVSESIIYLLELDVRSQNGRG